MADREGDDAERPREAQGEDCQHREGLGDPPERKEQQAKREGEGQGRGELAVGERRAHLVVRQRRTAGDAGLNAGELCLKSRDTVPDVLDGRAVTGEASASPHRIGEDEEQALVVREEVASIRIVLDGPEQSVPGGPVGRRAGDGLADLREEGSEEAKIAPRRAILQAEIEEVADEGDGELPVHGLEQRHQPGCGGKGLDEVLVIEDALAQLRECRLREIEERALVEIGQRDPVREVIEGDGAGAELPDEAGGICLGFLRRPPPDDDDDLVKLAEVP